MSKVNIKILSWDSYQNLSLQINGKEYVYEGVNIDLYFKLKALLRYKNYSKVFSILRALSRDKKKGD